MVSKNDLAQRSEILTKIYIHISCNSSIIHAKRVDRILEKSLVDIYTREDFVKFFSDDSNRIPRLGEKSLKLIREYLNITEVKICSDNEFYSYKENPEYIKICEYLRNNYPEQENRVTNALGRYLYFHDEKVKTKEDFKTLIYDSYIRGIGERAKEVLKGYFENSL